MSTIAETLPMIEPADWLPGAAQSQWTYSAYAVLPNDRNRYEIVNGVVSMAPTLTTWHQSATSLFTYYLTAHIQIPGLGRVFAAPTDVELGPHDVVQPDVAVVLHANQSIITPSRLLGAPDLVVEIVSPSTVGYDRRQKQDAYARAGVAEYWVADPNAKTVELLVLRNGAYQAIGVFLGKAVLPSLVANVPVRVEQFFE